MPNVELQPTLMQIIIRIYSTWHIFIGDIVFNMQSGNLSIFETSHQDFTKDEADRVPAGSRARDSDRPEAEYWLHHLLLRDLGQNT